MVQGLLRIITKVINDDNCIDPFQELKRADMLLPESLKFYSSLFTCCHYGEFNERGTKEERKTV